MLIWIRIRLSSVIVVMAVVVVEGVPPVQVGEPLDAVVHHRRQTLDGTVDKVGGNVTNSLG